MSSVKTRILIISDTHCARLSTRDGNGNAVLAPFTAPLPRADLLIHCGDLTYTGRMEQYHQALDMLKQIEAPIKLVIAGNHDLSLDRDFVFGHIKKESKSAETAHYKQFTEITEEQADATVNEARNLWSGRGRRADVENITFLDEGIHHISLQNGAQVNIYASPYTPEFCDWAFSYARDEDRFNTPLTSLSDAKNIAPYPMPSFSLSQQPIDIAVTHGPPYSHLDKVGLSYNAGCPHLLRAIMCARPLIHCFGHIHEGWGAEVVEWADCADAVTQTSMSISTWKGGGWQDGVTGIRRVNTDLEKVNDDHGAFLDVSSQGEYLCRGQQTALINASIMDVQYNPVNAPWIVDVDLPTQ